MGAAQSAIRAIPGILRNGPLVSGCSEPFPPRSRLYTDADRIGCYIGLHLTHSSNSPDSCLFAYLICAFHSGVMGALDRLVIMPVGSLLQQQLMCK